MIVFFVVTIIIITFAVQNIQTFSIMRTTSLSILFTILLLQIGISEACGATNDKEKITITGTVVDEDNEPIIGSSVYLNSGSNTVWSVSDFNGKFTLSVVPEGETFGLTVSYIGFKTLNQSFRVDALNNSKGTVKVRMLEDKRKNKKKNSSIIARDFGNSTYDFLFNTIQTSNNKRSPQDLCKEGDKYYNGTDGVTKNYAKALELYLQAAEQGYAWAQTRVGYMYDLGQGTSEDNMKAMTWYTKAAEQGNLTAQNNIGALYEKGEGVTKDYTLAAQWYQKAADQNNARSQANLAELYFYGQGVPQDYNQAFIWALRASEQGDVRGQFRLGYLYDLGKGVTQNYTLAREWYLKAAEQGNTGSMLNLGVIFEHGKGVKKNDSEALAWYNKAADNGNTKAKEYAKDLTSKGVKPASTITAATMDLTTLLNISMQKNKMASASTSKIPTTTKTTASTSTSYPADYSKMTAEQLYNEASKYYNGTNGVTKDYQKAFEIYEQAAKKGSARAQYYIAEMYYYGIGLEKDEIVGYQWYKKAADNGDSIACNRLGNMFYSGKTVPQNYSTAFSWYKKSAEKGYKWGQFNLADMYFDGKGCEKDYAQAAVWFQKAAKQNIPEAQNRLGICYDNGYGVPENDAKAVEYFKKAAEQGFDWGQYNLGCMYKKGEGCEKDYKQAIYWFQKAADQKISEAYNQLGICYGIGGYGISKDYTKAFDCYKKSAEMGYNWGQYNLANRYYNGEGCEKDYTQAAAWYLKAAEQNIPDAQNTLGICYDNGYGVTKDAVKAVEYFKKAAEQGYDWGQYNLANKYYAGIGCEKDSVKAAFWFEKAASQGLADAQSLLAWGYFNGFLVNKDIKKALEWIEKAAQQGDAQTQSDAGYMFSEQSPFMNYEKAIYWTQKSANQNNPSAFNNLGWFYEHGYGVDKDLNQAFTYYKKAADLNSSGGMRHVGEFYEKGWVVEKDVLEAAIWYKKAAKAGNDKAKVNLSSITARLSDKGTTSSSPRQETTYASTNSVKDLPPMGKRIALIIGNSDYANGTLMNPVNDAQDMRTKLQLLGFEVMGTTNIESKGKMREEVKKFCTKANSYDAALFFYSGHARQDNGENYLIPTRCNIESEADVEDQCLAMNWVVKEMQATGAKNVIVLLDACRNAPPIASLTRDNATQGLAIMTAKKGTFIGFSTQPGNVALDGRGQRNSPYTAAILKMLDQPALPHYAMFRRVKEMVLEATDQKQMPDEDDKLPVAFYFNLNQ